MSIGTIPVAHSIPVRTSPILLRAAATALERQLAHLISGLDHAFAVGEHLARRAGVGRRDIHDRVVGEEIAWAQQKRHRLDRHHGEVFGRRDVSHAKGVPEDHILVLDGLAAVAHPLGQPWRRLTAGLGDVAPGGPELVIPVCAQVSRNSQRWSFRVKGQDSIYLVHKRWAKK